jgi:mono/diheme cytochrome c family protein
MDRSATPSWLSIGLAAAFAALAGPLAAAEYEDDIQPLVAKYCHGCHGPEKKKGGLDLSRFASTEAVLADFDVWRHAVARINLHEMPPKAAPQLRHDEMARVDRWFQKLPRPERDCDEIANDANLRWYRGYVMSRRLTHEEYDNTLRDLLGVDLRPSRAFPSDGSGGEGFDTAGNALFTPPILLEKYLAAADGVLAAVFAGLREDAPAEARAAAARLLIARPGPDLSPHEAAHRVVAAFARRAFRRPVGDEETERLLALFDRAASRGDSFEEALRLPLKAVLVSPHFLFLVEPEPEEAGVFPLNAHQLASRLSYFLWSSLPDEELFRLADDGRLLDPEVLRGQVRRLLADPRARALGEVFALQWLGLGDLGGAVKPDPKLYPEFDEGLAASMRREVAVFFHDLVAGDRSLVELLDAHHTFLDGRLARHYGLAAAEAPDGEAPRRVELTDPQRGGLLGMAAIHLATSFPARTSPVLRGRWVLESLLGARVPPPPANVPSLAEKDPNAGAASLRERLEAHRQEAECRSCHERMDPLGFGLENFDVLGRWRSEEGGKAVDARGTLPSGETFASPAELKAVLVQKKDEVMTHLARKLLGYALGRDLNKFDECVIEEALKALKARDYRAAVLFETVALSYPFRHRFAKK